MADAKIRAVITAKDEASSVLKSFGGVANGIGGALADVAKVAAVGLVAAGGAAVAFGVTSVKAYADSESKLSQLNAVLASTGGVAGVTAAAAIDLSKALQKTTTFSDEEVLSAENLLLTFTKIGKDIFPQATKTVLNMATALGEDTKSASIQLGKALQDPVLGITALRRVGVNFSDAQKDVIQKLVDTGKSAEAQQMILKELETEFGNSAEAARHTFGGSLKALKNQFNDVQEAVGAVITKSLQPFIQRAADFLAAVDWDKVIKRVIQTLISFGNRMKEIGKQIYDVFVQVEQYLQPKLVALWHSFDQQLIPTLTKLWHEVLEPLVPVIGVILVAAIGFVIDALNLLIKIITPVTNFLLEHKTAVLAVAAAFGTLVAAMAIGAAINAVTVGFATLQLVTIPGLIAELGALSAAFVAALPVVAVAVAAAAIVAAIITIKDAWDAVNSAARAAQNLDNAASEQQIRDYQKKATAARAIGDTKAVNQYSNAIAALGGGRASGGAVTGGTPYLVGERGAEVIIPNQSGTVVPNNKIGGMGGAVNITINAGAYMGSRQDARTYAKMIADALKDYAAMNGQSTGQVLGI